MFVPHLQRNSAVRGAVFTVAFRRGFSVFLWRFKDFDVDLCGTLYHHSSASPYLAALSDAIIFVTLLIDVLIIGAYSVVDSKKWNNSVFDWLE